MQGIFTCFDRYFSCQDPQARVDFIDGNTSQKSFLSDDLFAVVEGHHRTKERRTAIEVRSAWETKILSL